MPTPATLSTSRFFGLISIVLLVLVCRLQAAEAPILMSIDPETPVAGEESHLVLTSDLGYARLRTLPEVEGMEFLRSQPFTALRRMADGTRLYQCAYNIRPTREGTIRIPAVEAEVDGRTYTLPEKEFRVRSTDSNMFMRIDFAGSPEPPQTVYVGQDVPLTVSLYIAKDFLSHVGRRFQTQIYLPQPSIDNGSLRQYVEPQSGVEIPYRFRTETESLSGVEYLVYRYETALRPKSVGEASGSFRLYVPVLEVRQRGYVTTTTEIDRQLTVEMPPVSVKQLPVPPATDAHLLNLVGSFDLSLTVDRSVARVGEDVELVLRAVGRGGMDGVKLPELTFPGITVYPPKISDRGGQVDQLEARWVLVPKGPTIELRPLSFMIFDTAQEEYRQFDLPIDLTVLDAAGQTIWPLAKPIAAQPTTDTSAAEVPAVSSMEIRPVRPLSAGGGGGLVGLAPAVGGLLLLAGPLLFVGLFVTRRRRDRIANDPAALRRRRALATRAALATRLEGAGGPEFADLLRDDLLPWLVDVYGLPPGATLDDVANVVTDPALAEQLRLAGRAAYMPDAAHTVDRGLLARAVRAAGVLAMFVLAASASAQTTDPQAAYQAGDFTAAAETYTAWTQAHPQDPTGWYNLGNCHFSVADYARALACYERAALLAPRDRDVRANLDVTRAKLGLKGTTPGTTLDMIRGWRDSVQPREWLLTAAGLWLLAWAFWGWAAWQRRRFHWATAACAVLALVAVQAWYAQQHGRWRSGQAVAIANTALYVLPNAEPGAARGPAVPAGSPLIIIETRGTHWYRVRLPDGEGWLPTPQVHPTWP